MGTKDGERKASIVQISPPEPLKRRMEKAAPPEERHRLDFLEKNRFIRSDRSHQFIGSLRRSARLQAAIVKSASVEEFSAVSQESCRTPMMKPTATTCIATD